MIKRRISLIKRIIINNNRLYDNIMIPSTSSKQINNETSLSLSIRSKNEPKDIQLIKSTLIHQCANYIVINKPHDIRMDGDFDVTIQKLLLNWIPNSTLDNIKWVHQLDYATSGVLCIARNKDSAAIASSSFSNRCAKKQYLAILQGKLVLDYWPLFKNRLNFNEKLDILEMNKEKDKITNKTNNNNNNNTMSNNWQRDIMNQNLIKSFEAFQTLLNNKKDILNSFIENKKASSSSSSEKIKVNKRLSSSNITNDDILAFSKYKLEDYSNNSKLRKALRKILKANGIEIEQIPCIGNSMIITDEYITEPKKPSNIWLQGLYKPPENSIYRIIDNNGKEKLIIAIPVAEIDGDFRCEPGYEENPGKISITEVEILEYGKYKDHDITKVIFTPITGRRHQLRVHSKCIGHPICGDGTYNDHPLTDIAERMFLHAYNLQLLLPDNYKSFFGKNTTFINSDNYDNNISKTLISVQTDDPFPINNEKQLIF